MDNLEINPLVGVGPILFGMSRSQVRELLGAGFREFLKTPTSKALTDDYAGYALHVYYDPENSCKGIEFFKPAQVKLNGRMLLGDSFRNALRYFQHIDATVQLKSTGLLSTRFGISLYAPNAEDAIDEPVETVYVFRKAV
jgi:hypothetical protein